MWRYFVKINLVQRFKGGTVTAALMGMFFLSSYAAKAEPYPREFVQPTKTTQYNSPESWPIQFDRDPVNLAPADSNTEVLIIGSGLPTPNAFRTGPSLAVIANGYPYFVDAGEGVWRGGCEREEVALRVDALRVQSGGGQGQDGAQAGDSSAANRRFIHN